MRKKDLRLLDRYYDDVIFIMNRYNLNFENALKFMIAFNMGQVNSEKELKDIFN